MSLELLLFSLQVVIKPTFSMALSPPLPANLLSNPETTTAKLNATAGAQRNSWVTSRSTFLGMPNHHRKVMQSKSRSQKTQQSREKLPTLIPKANDMMNTRSHSKNTQWKTLCTLNVQNNLEQGKNQSCTKTQSSFNPTFRTLSFSSQFSHHTAKHIPILLCTTPQKITLNWPSVLALPTEIRKSVKIQGLKS